MNARAQRWFWGASIGMGLSLVAVVCVLLLYVNDHPPSETSDLVEREPSVVVPSQVPSTIKKVVAIQEPPQLPILDFPPGSVEEACGLNEFPPHWATDENLEGDNPPDILSSSACRAALESYLSVMNPYLFLWGEKRYHNRPAAFVVLENPLTFKRIFTDPAGDLARVQDALSRPECLLESGEKNWELQESCHADAFLNYALVNRFCFDEGVSDRERMYYWEEDNPTPEQDRFMWKQELEDDWVRTKCEELNPTLKLTEYHRELYALVMSFSGQEKQPIFKKWPDELLIELAARLGDDAAGLTQSYINVFSSERHLITLDDPDVVLVSSRGYREEGYKYGRFAELLTSVEWRGFAQKRQPTVDRFQRAFHMLARLDSRKPDPRDEFEFDWQWVARHLCEPPYDESELYYHEDEEIPELRSCQEIVHEIRQSGTTFRPLLDVLDKFEQVALELEVYE